MAQETEPVNIKVTELAVNSGGPREVSPVVCPHSGDETEYKPVDFVHSRYRRRGYLFVAKVHAHVCPVEDCGSVFFLPEVAEEIAARLRQALVEKGLVKTQVER